MTLHCGHKLQEGASAMDTQEEHLRPGGSFLVLNREGPLDLHMMLERPHLGTSGASRGSGSRQCLARV